MQLTRPQRKLYNFIVTYSKKHGYTPSYREIMKGLKYTSTATVALHVNSLVERGYMRKRYNAARSLEVVTELSLDERIERALQGATIMDVMVLNQALIMLGYEDKAETLKMRHSGVTE